MTWVGVRELRQRASELLRLVERGETVEITDRGRPVALLGPLPAQRLGGELGDFVTYDERMAAIARQLGHRVSAPS